MMSRMRVGAFPFRATTAGLLALLVAGCGESQAGEAPGRAMVDATRRHLEIVAEAAGTLEPIRRVEVMSKASGEVVEVLVDTGDRVEPGTLIARIDPRDVQNEFNQADADLQVARERYQIAEAQLRRSENLLAAGVITDQEHENRNLEHANARASLVRAEQTLDLARVRLEDVTIRSPLSGVVLERTVEEGQVISSPSGNVSGGTVLVTVADLDVMQVRALVNETDVGRIQAGMSVTVQVDAFQDRAFEGHVEKIEPQARVEQSVVNYPVIVRLDNQEGILRPGMSANVTILLAERPSALTLPNNAIVGFNELATAGSVLGVPNDRLEMDQSVFQELRAGLIGEPGQAGQRREGERPEGDRPEGDRPEGDRIVRPDGLPANVEAMRRELGNLSQEEIRRRMQEMGGGAARSGRGIQSGQGTPGIVFVAEPDGSLWPRAVLVGVTDWSNSEILAGLEEGERVAVLGGAQLQAQRGGNPLMRRVPGGIPFF